MKGGFRPGRGFFLFLEIHTTAVKRTESEVSLPFDAHSAVHRNIISIVKPTRCTNVSNLFYFGMTLHVSDGLFVHHQEFKIVHTPTGICQTDTAVCLLTGLTNACCCMYSLELLMMDGKTARNM